MSFTPRYTMPDPSDVYYSTWDRFYWLDISPYGGNCTGYAYGRFGECAGRNIYNDFYIIGLGGNTDAQNWIYNTWPDQTVTSGSIDLQLGDILVYGGNFGHVEIVEAISGNSITTSYSVWASSYSNSLKFGVRTINKPTWGSALGDIEHNDGTHTYYSGSPFIGYIHNKYIEPGPEPPTPTTLMPWLTAALRLRLKRMARATIKRRYK